MIEGKVAAIINSRELAINRGSEHGVKEGMRFEVIDTTAGEITDPETGEPLGLIEGVKVRIEAVNVHDGFTIAQTYELVGGSRSLASMLNFEPARPITLRTDEAIFAPLTEQGSYVKRGDVVRQIVGADEESS